MDVYGTAPGHIEQPVACPLVNFEVWVNLFIAIPKSFEHSFSNAEVRNTTNLVPVPCFVNELQEGRWFQDWELEPNIHIGDWNLQAEAIFSECPLADFFLRGTDSR
jgi:hypothetical protein